MSIVKVGNCPYNQGMSTTYAIPPLTADLVEQIVYAMENQNEIAVLDLAEGIVTFEEESGSDKTVHLPKWSSADGFDLMARFAARNRSPRLKAALAKGHGVFRAFKDVLDTDADLKQRWHSFKHHEMEKVVTSWYRKLKQREARHEENLDMADALLRMPSYWKASAGMVMGLSVLSWEHPSSLS